MSHEEDLIAKALERNNLLSLKNSIPSFTKFLLLLQQWNRVFNLTSINDFSEMIDLHLIDSLLLLPFLTGQRFLDVGSGGGLPGIPLAILNPHQEWVLLDKNNKKTHFLTQASAELGLKNVSVVQSRCEDFHPEQGFDTILARAFATLKTFADVTQHLLNSEGKLLAMKGKYPQEELAEVARNFTIKEIVRLQIKGRKVERHLVCLQKKE